MCDKCRAARALLDYVKQDPVAQVRLLAILAAAAQHQRASNKMTERGGVKFD